MAMTKKERERMEAALTAAALRTTSDVAPDVPPPTGGSGLTNGWLPVGAGGDWPRVDKACSSSVHHGIGQWDKTTSQGTRRLYSTKMLALKALRRAVEMDCAKRLRSVDKMIEAEEQGTE